MTKYFDRRTGNEVIAPVANFKNRVVYAMELCNGYARAIIPFDEFIIVK